MSDQPLLTIGIPTYNRGHLLEGLLNCIVEDLKSLENKDLVQIVVSDNKSIDNTANIVSRFNHIGCIDYFCNSENIGACNNVLKIGNELAKGKFCWIIGDDDLLRQGVLQYVLQTIVENEVVDIIYMNLTYENDEERSVISKTLPIVDSKIFCTLGTSQLLENAQPLVDHTIYSALFTGISSLIFKTQVWIDNFVGYQYDKPFQTLNVTFPHTVILSNSLINKKVYYIAYPYLAFFVGAQEWLGEWPFLNFIRVLELSDLFQKLGSNKNFLTKYRQRVFELSDEVYFQLVTKTILRYKKHFSFFNCFQKYMLDKNFINLNNRVKRRVVKFYAKKYLKLLGIRKFETANL